MYTNLPNSSKNQLLELLYIWLDHYIDYVSLEVIIVIKDNFFIDSTIENISNQVVNILAKASSIDKFKSEIQKHTLLLKKLIGRYIFYFILISYWILFWS